LSFKINSGEINALRRKLKKITDDRNPSTTSKWAKIIENTANDF